MSSFPEASNHKDVFRSLVFPHPWKTNSGKVLNSSQSPHIPRKRNRVINSSRFMLEVTKTKNTQSLCEAFVSFCILKIKSEFFNAQFTLTPDVIVDMTLC